MNTAKPIDLGPYRLDALLGKGGMGEVYKAWDERLRRWVAVKHLLPDEDNTDNARARFRREARLLARLRHASVVQVYDLIERDDGDWLVMEFVEGPTLTELLRDGPLDPDRVLACGRRISSGLAAAHRAGIVHRDLKGENVMVPAPDEIRILDFGLAKSLAPFGGPNEGTAPETFIGAAALSHPGQIMGTPRAMSPEQARGLPVDERTDLFALGVLLYELLTARSPFLSHSLYEILHRVATHVQTPVAELDPRVPIELSRLIDRLLAKDPARRPENASVVAESLQHLAMQQLADRGSFKPHPDLNARDAPALDGPTVRDAPALDGPTVRDAPSLDGPTVRDAPALDGPTVRDAPSPTLRRWDPPEYPAEPYPVLLPYTHPDLLPGRERELAKLRRLLRRPLPFLGMCAPSGTGKSSLLLAGLAPMLRREGVPVAITRHPHEAGLARRLLDDLIEDAPHVEDHDGRAFAARLEEIGHLAREPPVLIVDQLEEILRTRSARARFGPLLAATSQPRAGADVPPCRWVLAMRKEYHGEIAAWMRDVLEEARELGSPEHSEALLTLPHDLSSPHRFHSMPLPPLATTSSGRGAHEKARAIFLDAIVKPLRLRDGKGAPRYPGNFAPGHAQRLAEAFAEARIAQPDAPLGPELQVVLAHLLQRRTGDPEGASAIEVPEDPGSLLGEALENHLRRALDTAFPATSAGSDRTRRTRALLALRALADTAHREGDATAGMSTDELTLALGEGGDEVLRRLAMPLTRLVVARYAPEGLRWTLSHDRLAEIVIRLVEEEGRSGGLALDSELLALRRVVSTESVLWTTGEKQTARLSRRHYRMIASHADALLGDERRRAWWDACRRRRSRDLRRSILGAAVLILALTLVGLTAWNTSTRRAEQRALLEQVSRGEPGAALAALDLLSGNAAASESLDTREEPWRLLEHGIEALAPERRDAAVLRTVEMLLPRVERAVAEAPQDAMRLIAVSVWALDFGPARGGSADRAHELRERVIAPLRALRPLPATDPIDWVEIPGGTFFLGTDDAEKLERPRHPVRLPAYRIARHEVTHAQYRLLMPEHVGEDDHPAGRLTWYAAQTYAAWLGARLPTEAEWEYAARGGCERVVCDRRGDPIEVNAAAWTSANAADLRTGEILTHPVMQREPNGYGLFDMLGNAWEWTADWFAPYPAAVDEAPRAAPWGPAAPESLHGGRVIRGGGVLTPPSNTRVTRRTAFPARAQDATQGFRVVTAQAIAGAAEPLESPPR